MAPGARAGDNAPEAVIGTFETTRDARAAQGKPATFDFAPAVPKAPAPAVAAPDTAAAPVDDEISRAYADGMDALENGKADVAQRKLEYVVARDPDGYLAKTARTYLADLYRGESAARPRQPAATPPPAKFATAPSALGAADVGRQDKPQIRSDVQSKTEFPVAANVEEDFIVTAGDRVFFASGNAELGQRARIVLAAQARWLTSHPEYTAIIEGHADDGALPDDQSLKIAEARAAAVRDRLVAEGVPAGRLSLLSQGRKAPVANCPGSDCAAQNRRVVTLLKGQGRDFGQRSRGPALASDGGRLPTQ